METGTYDLSEEVPNIIFYCLPLQTARAPLRLIAIESVTFQVGNISGEGRQESISGVSSDDGASGDRRLGHIEIPIGFLLSQEGRTVMTALDHGTLQTALGRAEVSGTEIATGTTLSGSRKIINCGVSEHDNY